MPSDDLGALKEMIERRLKHKEWRFPDLMVIDGGRPQVLAVSRILRDNNINIPMLGISKMQRDKLVFRSAPKNLFKNWQKCQKIFYFAPEMRLIASPTLPEKEETK